MQACVHHGHPPVLAMLMVYGDFVPCLPEIKGDVAVTEEIVVEPLLDDILLVPGTDYELVMAIIGVLFHNVP